MLVVLEYDNKVFDGDWTFQRNDATPLLHRLSQEWCYEHFPSLIDKDHWSPNSPDLNPLDYSIWDEFVQQMNRDKFRSKRTLIEELKRGVKCIRL